MFKHISITLLVSLLAAGCCFREGSARSGEPVVSPISISTEEQENQGLYLEDTEHWWEVR